MQQGNKNPIWSGAVRILIWRTCNILPKYFFFFHDKQNLKCSLLLLLASHGATNTMEGWRGVCVLILSQRDVFTVKQESFDIRKTHHKKSIQLKFEQWVWITLFPPTPRSQTHDILYCLGVIIKIKLLTAFSKHLHFPRN